MSALAPQLVAAAFAAGQHLGVAGFRLRQSAFGAGDTVVHLFRRAADLVIGSLQYLCQGQLDMRRNAVKLREPFGADLFEKRDQRLFIEPAGGLR